MDPNETTSALLFYCLYVNLWYNIVDIINKIGFCLAVCMTAVTDSN